MASSAVFLVFTIISVLVDDILVLGVTLKGEATSRTDPQSDEGSNITSVADINNVKRLHAAIEDGNMENFEFMWESNKRNCIEKSGEVLHSEPEPMVSAGGAAAAGSAVEAVRAVAAVAPPAAPAVLALLVPAEAAPIPVELAEDKNGWFEDQERLAKNLFLTETAVESLEYFKEQEKQLPLVNYLPGLHAINIVMRARLVDWLVKVAERYVLHQKTLFLTISIIDRFLSTPMGADSSISDTTSSSGGAASVSTSSRSVVSMDAALRRAALDRISAGRLRHATFPVNNFQLLGVTAMFIAAKYEEMRAKCWLGKKDLKKRAQILTMENQIHSALGFRYSLPSFLLSHWSARLHRVLPFSDITVRNNVTFLADYIMEETLIDGEYHLIKLASQTAAVAFFLAACILEEDTENAILDSWWGNFEELTAYHPGVIAREARELFSLLSGGKNKELRAVIEKYSNDKYNQIGKTYAKDKLAHSKFGEKVREACAHAEGL